MATIVTRAGKGSALTFTEADANFTNLNTAKAETASPTFTGTVVLPATTSIATVSATEIGYLDGVTSAIQTQMDLKAPLASPALTGNPTAPTAAVGTTTTQLATTAFVSNQQAYIHLRDEKADGTQGGASSSTTNHIRVLNTEVTDTHSLCSLSSNQFTLTAGTYRILASAPCLAGTDHRAFLYNATGAVTVLQGENEYAGAAATETVQTRAWVRGQFTIAASQALELRHYINTGVATNGLGAVSNGSGVEVYTQVELWRVG